MDKTVAHLYALRTIRMQRKSNSCAGRIDILSSSDGNDQISNASYSVGLPSPHLLHLKDWAFDDHSSDIVQ